MSWGDAFFWGTIQIIIMALVLMGLIKISLAIRNARDEGYQAGKSAGHLEAKDELKSVNDLTRD